MKMKARMRLLSPLLVLGLLLTAAFGQSQAPQQGQTPARTPAQGQNPGQQQQQPQQQQMQRQAPASPAAARPTPTPMPPDRKAYTEAMRHKDPQQKMEALEKFVADFPDSFMAVNANQTILSTLIKTAPEQQDRILAQARKTIQSAQEFARGSTYTSVVSTLLEAGIMLDKVEELAREGLAWTDEDLAKRARQTRAPHLASLGRLYIKRGKLKEAEKNLKEAIAANPSLTDAALGLAELYEKKKDEKMAVEYYAAAVLTGRAKPEVREKLREAYKRTHNGTLDGLEAMLDAKYKRDFPLPVNVEHYKPGPDRTTRTVLAEVFTGAGCPPCVAADLAFDAFLERYSRQDVAVIMYHLHIPLPDPMTNPSTQVRQKYYAVGGVPTYVIDGEKASGGGSRDMTQGFYNRVRPTIEKRLAEAAGAEIKLEAALQGGAVKVAASVDGVKSESKKLRLQIALAEEMLRYSGENGVRFHPMVVRSLAGPEAGGFALEPGKMNAEWSFDIAAIVNEAKAHLDEFEEKRKDDNFSFSEKKHEIDANSLVVVAFVQDDETKAILQSKFLRLKPEVASNVGK